MCVHVLKNLMFDLCGWCFLFYEIRYCIGNLLFCACVIALRVVLLWEFTRIYVVSKLPVALRLTKKTWFSVICSITFKNHCNLWYLYVQCFSLYEILKEDYWNQKNDKISQKVLPMNAHKRNLVFDQETRIKTCLVHLRTGYLGATEKLAER